MLRRFDVLCWTMVSIFVMAPTARAGLFQGSITGYFTNPVLTGYTDGKYFDNTHTAVYQVFGNEVVWGSNAASEPGSSSLIFAGNPNVSYNDGTTFCFGTFSFFNGTSELNSLIFGVDLVLNFQSTGANTVESLTIPIDIETTNNGVDRISSADYISVGGLGLSFFAFESDGASADLKGHIQGDPQFVPTGLTLADSATIYIGSFTPHPYDPNDYLTVTGAGLGALVGFVGPTPTNSVPEPSSLVLMSIGALGLAIRGYRSSRYRTASLAR